MSDKKVTMAGGKSLAKGIAAGLIGGLAGMVAKTFAERIFPPRTHGEPEPSEVLAENISPAALTPAEKVVVAEGIRWGFGAAAGAAYGALTEYYPAATAKEGASFGMALEALTQETALPALGLSTEPEDMTTRERVSEMTSYVVYGIATEMVRKLVRKWL
jgi:putative membrane protein